MERTWRFEGFEGQSAAQGRMMHGSVLACRFEARLRSMKSSEVQLIAVHLYSPVTPCAQSMNHINIIAAHYDVP